MPELFAEHEINRRPLWPRLARTAAASLVLHALLFSAVATFPTLQSMLRLVGIYAGTEYGDEDYTLASVRQSDVTMLKLGGGEKLRYPPGYFTNNPAAPVAEAEPLPTPTPEPTPKPKPSPTPAATPDATPAIASDVKNQQEGQGTGALASLDGAPKTEAEADKLAEQTKTKKFPRVNAKPFKDLLAKAKAMMDAGELDLDGNLTMTIEADRNEDGTLSNIRVTKVSTDNAKLRALAIEFVQALSASRALAALEGTSRLRMTVESNAARVGAVVTTQVESPERAKEMELGYGGMIALGRLTRSGRDEGEIYKNTRVAASGSEVRMTFGMTRTAVKGMLSKHVPAAATTTTPPKPAADATPAPAASKT